MFYIIFSVDLPKEGPQISGKTRDEYETGEHLALNCTSHYSFPPARLSWFINDIPVRKKLFFKNNKQFNLITK